ncbi:hypothetical protein GCM10009753_68450 [Streptantibioticus ferralitis]
MGAAGALDRVLRRVPDRPAVGRGRRAADQRVPVEIGIAPGMPRRGTPESPRVETILQPEIQRSPHDTDGRQPWFW